MALGLGLSTGYEYGCVGVMVRVELGLLLRLDWARDSARRVREELGDSESKKI